MVVKGNTKSRTSTAMYFNYTAVHLNSALICLTPNHQRIPQYFFWLKKSSLPQISFCLVACEPFRAQFRCHSLTLNADFFSTFQPTPFLIALNGSSVCPLSEKTGIQGTKQPQTNILGQNFRVGISSRELCEDAILMTSSYRQNCFMARTAEI